MLLYNLIDSLISDLENNKYIKGIRKEILFFHTEKIILSENNIKLVKKILKILKKHNNILEDNLLYVKNNGSYKKLLKEVKRYFHSNYYSFFTITKDNKIFSLEFYNLEKDKLLKYKEFLLNSHKSTYERLKVINFIREFFQDEIPFFFKTKKFENIIDLGSGFNPLLLVDFLYFNNYIFIDLNKLDVKLLENLLKNLNKFEKENKEFIGRDFDIYFEKNEVLNFLEKEVTNDEKSTKKNNLVIMLKLLDNLENNKRNFSLEFFKDLIKLGFENFLVSFSTKSFCGKDFKLQSRSWFFNFLEKNIKYNFNYKIFNTENEMFIIINVRIQNKN